ncbi:MAG TPA: hypothetical protein VNE18_10310 [Rhodanobacter sp.]|nr:hypothetical protein [Rhodanobacter sp.]
MPGETITFYSDDTAYTVPAKFVVCQRCEGRGTHANPSIDGDGLTPEDFDEQGPDFYADYMSGVYDVRCDECVGKRVVLLVDFARMSAVERRAWDYSQAEEAAYRAIVDGERRMGA